MGWEIVASGAFDKKAKKYSRDKQIRSSLDACLALLHNEESPERLGNLKTGPLGGVYAYNLTKSIRLLYLVDYNTRTIKLIDIGDHKEVYGKD